MKWQREGKWRIASSPPPPTTTETKQLPKFNWQIFIERYTYNGIRIYTYIVVISDSVFVSVSLFLIAIRFGTFAILLE